jgi:hypothetical protein
MCAAALSAQDQRPNLLVADFEGSSYGDWTSTGDTLGSGPIHKWASKNRVHGVVGEGPVNSYQPTDQAERRVVDPPCLRPMIKTSVVVVCFAQRNPVHSCS